MVSYGSLREQLQEQQSKVKGYQGQIREQKEIGRKNIEVLKRVHPKTKPSIWFERKAEIGSIEGKIKTLSDQEKELVEAEKKLSQQEQTLKEMESKGYNIRETNKGYEFYKTVSSGGSVSGDYTVKVIWVNSEGKQQSVYAKASRLGNLQSNIESKNGYIVEVQSLGRGVNVPRSEQTKEIIGGGLSLWRLEQPNEIETIKQINVPVLDQNILTSEALKNIVTKVSPEYKEYWSQYIPVTSKAKGTTGTLKELTGIGPKDITKIQPSKLDIAEVRTQQAIQFGMINEPVKIKNIYKKELEIQGYEIYTINGKEFIGLKGTGEKYNQFLTKKEQLIKAMKGTPQQRVAGLGIWVSTSFLSWADPFSIKSTYQALTGRPEKAIETKAMAMSDLNTGKPFDFARKVITGPLATVGYTYVASSLIGGGVGAFEATNIGKYPLLTITKARPIISIGKTIENVKPLFTLTPAKTVEYTIGGYFGGEIAKQTIPIAYNAIVTKNYDELVSHLGTLAIFSYAGIKGYKKGKNFGLGETEKFLYSRETYTPGTKEAIRFKEGLKVARLLQDIEIKGMKTIDLTTSFKEVKPGSIKAFSNILEGSKRYITLGGSASTYAQLENVRVPRDIDLLVNKWKGATKKTNYIKQSLINEVLKTTSKEELATFEGYNIKTGRIIDYSKFLKSAGFDIHGPEFGKPGQYHRFGFVEQPRTKITLFEGKTSLGRIKALTASEQLFRKMVSSVILERKYRWGEYPGFPKPIEGYAVKGPKDIADAVNIAKELINEGYKSIFTKGRAIKANKALDLFLHPERSKEFGIKQLGSKSSFFFKSALKISERNRFEVLFGSLTENTIQEVYPMGKSIKGNVYQISEEKITAKYQTEKVGKNEIYNKSIYRKGENIKQIKPYVSTYEQKPISYYIPTIEKPYVPLYAIKKGTEYIPIIEQKYIPGYVPEIIPGYIPEYFPGYSIEDTKNYVPEKTQYAFPYVPGYSQGYVPKGSFAKKEEKRKRTTEKESRFLFTAGESQGYNVYVKERYIFKGRKRKPERFMKLNRVPLSRKDAMALGATAVDNSSSATFRIKPVNAVAQRLDIKVKDFDMIENKFYNKDDMKIEKTSFRIDSKGEIEGISALGWYAERRKEARVAKQKQMKRNIANWERNGFVGDLAFQSLIDVNIFKGFENIMKVI